MIRTTARTGRAVDSTPGNRHLLASAPSLEHMLR